MTRYVIADENKTVWVHKDTNGSYSLTTDKNKAFVFDSKPVADAVFKSNLSKLIKSKGVVVKAVTSPTTETVTTETCESPAQFGSSKYIISVLSDAVAKLNCRHISLSDELSKYDRQVTDIEHYIEFNSGKLNACDGYKAYKLLQDVLVERRKVKDELQMICMVKDKMAIPEDIANIDNKIKELETRRYEPRELKHLFNKEN